MSQYLFDVNVLLAMAWPRHAAHAAVQKWLSRHAGEGWASCPLTEAGFVRIISNPAFSRDALPLRQAVELLQNNLNHPAHHFWPDALGLGEALSKIGAVVGHQQITDGYLLALCVARKGTLVSLDTSIAKLAEGIPGRPFIAIPR